MSKGLGLALGALVLAAPTDSVAQQPVEMGPEYVESRGPKMRTTEEIIADIQRLSKQSGLDMENACRQALATVREIVGCEVVKTIEEVKDGNAQSSLVCSPGNSGDKKYATWDILAGNMSKCAASAEDDAGECIRGSIMHPKGRMVVDRENHNRFSDNEIYQPHGRDYAGNAQLCVDSLYPSPAHCITDDIAPWPEKSEVGMRGVLDHCSAAILKRLSQLDDLQTIQAKVVDFETATTPDQQDTVRTLLQMLEDKR